MLLLGTVSTIEEKHLTVVERGGGEADQDFATPRFRGGEIQQIETVESAGLTQDPGFHEVLAASVSASDTSERSSATASGFTSALRSPGS